MAADVNRLAAERSPYLLQHAANPVDWYPWGAEAFARARAENKPIFLSIGYSTCHWCHVMEHESFENEQIATLLNRDFVSVKVDREERPDVDRIYMSFVQSTTGQGGWPMSVFLTPELKPFFGGTYFPPVSRWGRPGLADLLRELAQVWSTDRPRVAAAAAELFARLTVVTGASGTTQSESTVAGPDALQQGVEQFQQAFDTRRGGFGDAPKFPRPSELLFLLREHARRTAEGTAADAPLVMAVETLRAMALGGMRDHVGGGFHRYSVDAEWRVPHFEKMLYDQAQLTIAFLEAWQATADPLFADVAADTIEYVLRDLRGADGGFYSAEDADSVPPDMVGQPGAQKREGAFYVWSDAEIGDVLGDDADLVRRRFGIEPGGNVPHDPHGEFRGLNVFYVSQSARSGPSSHSVQSDPPLQSGPSAQSLEDIAPSLARARSTLFDIRARRPKPHLDDKILTAWNGMMIGACARAARVLSARPGASRYLAAATRAAVFARTTLWNAGERRLLRRYRDGEAAIDAYAEDYACLIGGLLELFQADGQPAWLEWATALQARQDELFWDGDDAGWFSTTGDDPTLLLRLKEEYDGAEPAASSVSVANLLTLANLTGSDDYRRRAERTLARFGPRLGAAARVVPMMLASLATWHAPKGQFAIVGAHGATATRALVDEAARHYRPFHVVVPVDPGDDREPLSKMVPFVARLTARDGRPTAYLCRDFVCGEPIQDPAALARQI